MNLHRPYIPMKVRLKVAKRQARELGAVYHHKKSAKDGPGRYVKRGSVKQLLRVLFGERKIELHHRPALVNRRRYVRNGKVFYNPPANDPAHLVYLAETDHDVETRIRGLGAQRSDLGQARYNKKVAKNREKKPKRKTFRQVTRAIAERYRPKRQWPKRPMRMNRPPERRA